LLWTIANVLPVPADGAAVGVRATAVGVGGTAVGVFRAMATVGIAEGVLPAVGVAGGACVCCVGVLAVAADVF
jgi:hypothetical protein